MKNLSSPLIALSFAVASALALADSEQYKQDWFKGIGGETETSISGLKTTNGSWEIPAESASVESAALVLDLDSDEAATFTIGGVDGDSGETGTAQTLSVTGVFNPISAEDLLAGTEMNGKNAQVGFAVVGVKAGEGAMTYKYYAWVGAEGGATAVADWVELSELGTVAADASTALTIELNYWNAGEMTATFKIGNNSVTKRLTSEAAQNKKIASVSCTGSGTLNALSGAYQYAVAKVVKNGVETKYPTYDKAIEAGATDTTLVGLKAAVGDVTTKVSDTTKEIGRDSEGKVVIQTATSVLKGVRVGEVNGGAGKALAVNETLRKFLSTYCKTSYEAAGATAPAITAELSKNGANNLPLWQSYALGIDPAASVKPKLAEADKTDKENIILTIPALVSSANSGDFTITYKVGNNVVPDLSAIKIPMTETTQYPITISFE